MSWLEIPPDPILIDAEGHYEFRTASDLSGESYTEKRKRLVRTFEYRGMTQTCAATLCSSSAYENGTKSWRLMPIGGGGYNVQIIYDAYIGSWTEGSGEYTE